MVLSYVSPLINCTDAIIQLIFVTDCLLHPSPILLEYYGALYMFSVAVTTHLPSVINLGNVAKNKV